MTALNIPVREMTPDLMDQMEKEGLIIRLCPNHHDMEPEDNSNCIKALYEGVDGFGPHKIIALTINRKGFPRFGTHPDQEEFWLIGNNQSKPLYLLVARMKRIELEKKIQEHTLTEKDFYLIKAVFNDPEVSFFTMMADIPHAEGVGDEEGICPSFYVTESRDMILDICDLGDYQIQVG